MKDKGRADIDDWNKKKIATEVIQRKDGRDAVKRK
jgi:hypothetical protein